MWIETVHEGNIFGSLFFNVVTSGLLIYLILTKTDKRMKHYSRVMLIAVFVDLFAALYWALISLEMEFKDNYVYFRSYWTFSNGNLVLVLLPGAGFIVSVSSAAIQSIYRHVLIQTKRSMNYAWCLLYYCGVTVATVFIFAYACQHFVKLSASKPATDVFLKLKDWEDAENVESFYVVEVTDPYFASCAFALSAIVNTFVAVVIIFNYKMKKYFIKAANDITCSPQTLDLQKQLQRQLTAKLLVPGISSGIILINLAIFFLSTDYSGGLMMILLMPIPWTFCINYMTTIIFVKTYRNAVFGIFRKKNNAVDCYVSTMTKMSKT